MGWFSAFTLLRDWEHPSPPSPHPVSLSPSGNKNVCWPQQVSGGWDDVENTRGGTWVRPRWVFQSQFNTAWSLGSGVQVSKGFLCSVSHHHGLNEGRFVLLPLVAVPQSQQRGGENWGKRGVRAGSQSPVHACGSGLWTAWGNWAVQFCLLPSG